MASKHWLSRELVRSPVHLAFFLREEDFRKELKRLALPRDKWPVFVSESANATTHSFEYNGKQACIVCMHFKANRTIEQIHALLVHEAVHVWQHVREYIGEHSPSSEFEAYSIQNIAQSLMEAFKAQRSKKK